MAWTRIRLVRAAGTVLKIVVALWFLHTIGVVRPDSDTIGHAAVIMVVLAILVGPWLVRLARSLSLERAARIREQERAEVAAHLHDSVLQTLALIQTRSGDSTAVATLARRQERELRRWLFERPGSRAGDSVKTALEVAAGEVEALHGVPIEVVIVGDGAVDGRLDALVQAAREAMTNAAKFAGSERVDLYAEIDPARVEVFVRDRGVGFDPGAISPDRRGVRDSIFGRMQRHGGRAAVHSAPGEGTEVDLVMELAPA
jgi:signal transduction histidine kinase